MKFRISNTRKIGEICAAILALLWVYTGSYKLADHHKFLVQLEGQPLPKDLINIVSILIPIIELMVAIMLTIKKTRTAGFWISAVLLVAFTSYISLIMLNVFNNIPCSCAGVFEHMSWTTHLYFNIFCLIICFTGLYHQRRKGAAVTG